MQASNHTCAHESLFLHVRVCPVRTPFSQVLSEMAAEKRRQENKKRLDQAMRAAAASALREKLWYAPKEGYAHLHYCLLMERNTRR